MPRTLPLSTQVTQQPDPTETLQPRFDMLRQSLETELKTMKKRMSAATAEKAGTEKTMQDASEELTTTEKTLAADEESRAGRDARSKATGSFAWAFREVWDILSECALDSLYCVFMLFR